MKIINSFRGKYAFLSSFYTCAIFYNGRWFTCVEIPFQMEKGKRKKDREQIALAATPGIAKRMGRKVELRPDWEEIKIPLMEDLVSIKFSNPELAEKLLDTGDAELIEGNYWHDNFWGNCTCERCKLIKPRNNLGKILMAERESLREEYA